MALIRCPECNSEVSDRAGACPRCGFPIQQKMNEHLIRIKMPVKPSSGMFGAWRVIRQDTGLEIGKVQPKEIFEFESDKPVDLEIKSGGALIGFDFSVSPGKKYACSWSTGFFLPKLVCYEVDQYDSD